MFDNRAQSEMVGITLIIGIVLFTAIAALSTQTQTIEEYQTMAEGESAVDSMMFLSSAISKVAYDEVTKHATARISANQYGSITDSSSGSIKVIVYSWECPYWWYCFEDSLVLYERNLGEITYTNRYQTVAYQAGAIFREGRNGEAVMVSPPQFGASSNTVNLPLARINSERTSISSGRLQVSQIENQQILDARYGDGNDDVQRVRVVLESKYADAWCDYFRNNMRTGDGGTDISCNPDGVVVDYYVSNPKFFHITEGVVSIN